MQLCVCVCFLSNTLNPPIYHNTIVFFYQPVNSRETCKMKNEDRQATFISCVSRWCLKWLSCLSPTSALSHIVCSPFHYSSIKMSNSAVSSAACLSSPHLLHHFHFYFLCWNVATFLTHGKAMPNLYLSLYVSLPDRNVLLLFIYRHFFLSLTLLFIIK